MGASNSLAKQFKVVKDFNNFITNSKSAKGTNLLSTAKTHLAKLKEEAEKFFETYNRLDEADKIGGEGIDLNSYFNKICLSIEAFQECVKFIKENGKKDEITTVSVNFRNDFRKFVKQLTQLAETATQLLETILTKVSPLLMSEFYIELDIFDFALDVKKSNKPPYYTMTRLPVYELRDQIFNLNKKSISITAQHGAGKTILVPLFLACRLLTRPKSARYIIVIEHETSLIRNIVNTYLHLLYKKHSDKHDDDDIKVDDSVNVTSSVARILQFVNKPPFYPVIGVLSPFDALRLIHTVPDLQDFVNKSIFVIDDLHMRTVETDVLGQDIQRSILKIKKNDPHLVTMSTVRDEKFINFIGHVEEISVKNTNNSVDRKDIKCNSISDIRNRSLFREMHKFFNTWIDESIVGVGSVIVFVPSDKIGRRLYKEIFKFYSKENATNVCPLPSTIRKGEKTDDFYNRLLGDMTVATAERPEGTQTLFLMPMCLTGNVTPEESELICSQLPLPFIDKLARVFITTIKNEPYLQVQDLMAIFDTGIDEIEYFDTTQSAVHVQEQLLPKPFMDMHHRLLGANGDGIYFEFNVKKVKRPEYLIPSVKRSDLTRQLMTLRSFGVKFEDQRNLPTEPDHDLVNGCFTILKKIGIIDDTSSKDLTATGKEAAKYSSVSPFLALATTKFGDNRPFGYLCSLIIENSRILVTDSKSKLLCKHFNRDSDVVTLLESIREISEGLEEGYEDTGLSIGTIYAMYSQMESAFGSANNGRTQVVNAIKWAKSQPGGVYGMVNKFVSLIDKNEFLDKRKGSFVHVLGAGPESEPTLIYKANEVFKFKEEEKKKEKEKEEREETDAKFKFVRRPGWQGLQCPGNIYCLSLVVEEESKLNRGLIIHKDQSAATDSPGVMALKVDNPSLNSFFFVSLFEGYWSNRNTKDDFIGIYHTPYPKKEAAFLIHMTESDGATYLNYCPKNTAIENQMKNAIPILSSLMPFVPRSIIAKVDVPLCAIEVVGYGVSSHYTTHIHLVAEADSEKPFAYPINKATLEYAQRNIPELRKTLPLVRFGITGESFYYRSIHGREVEAEFTYPDVNPNIKSVFDQYHASHLVLLVDQNFPNKPPVPQLSWLQTGAGAVEADGNDAEDNEMMISVASKIMNGLGYAEKSADLFFVTLGGGYPKAGKGEVPDSIRGKVNYDGGSIKGGIYPLVRHFVSNFTRKQKLTEDIPLIELSSTNSWANYPANEVQRLNLQDQISRAVANAFGVKEQQSMATFLGPSMLVIRVEGIAVNEVTHKVKADIWDDNYQPCPADQRIVNALKGIGTVDFKITSVIHEPSINICVRNMRRLGLKENEFEDKIKSIAKKFGFLNSALSEYNPPENLDDERMGIMGDMQVELMGMASGIAFATLVTKEFPLKLKEDFNMTCTMATCRGMATINPRLGPAPEVGVLQRAVKVTPAEIEALKEMVAVKNAGSKKKKKQWNLDSNFNVLIIPASEEGALKEMMRQVRDKDEDTTCQFLCEPPQVLLPQSVYCYQEDGSVKALGICQQCNIEYFRSLEDLQFVIDPLTHMVDRKKLNKLENNLPGFLFIEEGDEKDGVAWPQIPLGQGVWALMSDPENLGPSLKAWFTAIIDFIVRKARHYFTFCPNHPDIPHRMPKPGINLKCPYCNFFYCATCTGWHNMNDRCAPLLGVKRCPYCKTPTFKVSGCNHITCPCGKHWCYKCETNVPYFNTAGECYDHLYSVHGGHST